MDKGEVTTLTLLIISLTYFLGRNAQNVYTPQIQIDFLFTLKLRPTSPQTPLHCSLTHFRHLLAPLHQRLSIALYRLPVAI